MRRSGRSERGTAVLVTVRSAKKRIRRGRLISGQVLIIEY